MTQKFKLFLSKFPEIKLPVTITEEDVTTFSKENEPIPERLQAEFIQPFEQSDEYTEYIPCFRMAGPKDFFAVVYWRGGLLDYQYILTTYSKSGQMIDRRTIAGAVSDGKLIIRSVARIDDDMSISIMSGNMLSWEEQYDASKSTTLELELLPDGRLFEMT